ncbi:uncharacterized protein LOC124418972 [Lucilia cuprina]|uniref:uncharacterized protein LOC124418972 n=1 Tax=Lucilia cuprina TaxID=7375 RepID=UPI001F06A55A|nr:uncharacterized protein LOC124418972 [Lucilia cuprina]
MDSKKSVAFLLLPYLFPSTVLKANGQSSTKLTKIEVQEKFIAHFDTLEQADTEERNSTELQPKIIFVAPFTNLKANVTLFDKKYTFENPLEAIECCFLIYMALNVEYSKETKLF